MRTPDILTLKHIPANHRGSMLPANQDRLRMASAAASIVAGCGLLFYFWWPSDSAHAVAPVEVTVAGHSVDLGNDPHDEAGQITARFLSRDLVLVADDHRVLSSREALGVEVDTARLASTLAHAADPNSAMRQAHARRRPGTPLHLDLPFELGIDVLQRRLIELKDLIDRPAASARFNTTEHRVVPAQVGRTLNVWASLDRIESHLRADEAEPIPLAIERVTPERAGDALANVRMTAVLGQFQTRYNRAETAADRTHNVRTAGDKVDGLVLLPGEVFDFNEVVGERNEAGGFRPAPVIAGGELVDGVGGGACQVAGTLHAAAYFAGLTILERHPHSRPSGYIKLGLDAVVSYPELNMRLRNDFDEPVVFQFSVSDGVVRAAVWGRERRFEVSFVRRIVEPLAYENRVEEDPELPDGVRVLVQRGIPGFRVKRWRLIRDVVINQTVRQSSSDLYRPTVQIWRVGTGGPAPDDYSPPPGDGHLEYVADEYLTLTQGPDIEGTHEQRRAGRTGRYGWTEREGFPAAPGPQSP